MVNRHMQVARGSYSDYLSFLRHDRQGLPSTLRVSATGNINHHESRSKKRLESQRYFRTKVPEYLGNINWEPICSYQTIATL